MDENSLATLGGKSFEELRLINQHGVEYWSARDLQPLLGYSQWRRFEQSLNRAIHSCNASGNQSDYHFANAGKMIEVGNEGLKSGGPKPLPNNQNAEEIEFLVNEMFGQNNKMALALRIHYFGKRKSRDRSIELEISATRFRIYVDMARQWLAGRLSVSQRF